MSTVLISLSQSRKKADVLILGCFEKEGLSQESQQLAPHFSQLVRVAIAKGRFEGKFGQTFSSYLDQEKEAPEIIALGLGLKKNFAKLCVRKTSGRIAQLAKEIKAKRVRIALESLTGGKVAAADAAGALAEMTRLALYDFDRYKTKKNGKSSEIVFEVLAGKKGPLPVLQKQMDWNQAVAEGVIRARDWINEPGNIMNPVKLVEEAQELACKKKLSCQILGLSELKRLKMNGILAVNQGSKTPPALIILEYGKAYKSKGTICLVGKGVTFDTGGISIKPAKDMGKMKYDMSGAAAVLSTMGILSDLGIKRHVVAVAPAVENMVGEDPQRPGDIIRMYNGKTVEVLNTDAEGRLILADALAYCAKYEPKAILDFATLTGMCAATFGDKAIGLMGNQEALIERVQKAGEETGERCWTLPLWDDYKEQIKGHHSDLYNIGGPYGGTITAGMFLKEFVPEKTAWAHLDIAGTAWTNSPRYDCPRGATGVGVKLLANFLAH